MTASLRPADDPVSIHRFKILDEIFLCNLFIVRAIFIMIRDYIGVFLLSRALSAYILDIINY